MRSEDVGTQKRFGIQNRPVDVGFGREVDDRIDPVAGCRRNRIGVTDISSQEAVTGSFADIGEVIAAARVGQGVEVRHLDLGPLSNQQADEMRSDEPRSAGHEHAPHCHHAFRAGERSLPMDQGGAGKSAGLLA